MNNHVDNNGLIWEDILYSRPREGAKCLGKQYGEEGYVGGCIYTDGYFETSMRHSNRVEITRWRVDLWRYVDGEVG